MRLSAHPAAVFSRRVFKSATGSPSCSRRMCPRYRAGALPGAFQRKFALKSASADSVIFAHNHPSGDPAASEEDIGLTKRLVEAGGIVGIDVLDHIIIGDNSFLSLKREGLF